VKRRRILLGLLLTGLGAIGLLPNAATAKADPICIHIPAPLLPPQTVCTPF